MSNNEIALAEWRREVEAMTKWANGAARELATAKARLARAKKQVRRFESRVGQ
jgi:hypothetical protein